MTRRDKISRAAVLVGIVIFGVLWYLKPQYSTDPLRQLLTESMLYRLLGSIVFFALSVFLGFRLWGKSTRALWLVFLPALAVVINNFPIIGLCTGEASLVRTDLLPLFLLDCLFIGVFEELAFRGVLFLAILEKRRASKKQIFLTAVISSAIFGLVHLANLIEGAGIGATILQVGYSFLIGGMCTIVLLRGGNLIFCILLHTLFDIGGRMIDLLGAGKIWNLPTIIVTALLGVAVTAWMLYQLWRVTPEDTNRFYPSKKEE